MEQHAQLIRQCTVLHEKSHPYLRLLAFIVLRESQDTTGAHGRQALLFVHLRGSFAVWLREGSVLIDGGAVGHGGGIGGGSTSASELDH